MRLQEVISAGFPWPPVWLFPAFSDRADAGRASFFTGAGFNRPQTGLKQAGLEFEQGRAQADSAGKVIIEK